METRRRQSRPGGGTRRRLPSSSSSRAALRRKVRELRRLVPGGEDAPEAGSLLLRAADYIARLRAQVELLKALTAICSAGPSPPSQVPAGDDEAEACVMGTCQDYY
ncbi:hypothetical protein PR202_gb03295 [Eleusine coracana subsp. coracana]|uniref:BHLH domain-containing protein n=1 Tax=Eleusine coracana subsp. coracana TaxID=191504 RepID=A0AAV5DZ33_ELECO|nr:hypothetical protein PR202_gb03295 [Eleusine coracana subsp. coracana]